MNEKQYSVGSLAADLYLDLVKKCLTRYVFGETYRLAQIPRDSPLGMAYRRVQWLLSSYGLTLVKRMWCLLAPLPQDGMKGKLWSR